MGRFGQDERKAQRLRRAEELAPPVPIAARAVERRPFLLDIRESRIRQGTSALQLRPKTFAVLRCLVARPGELVSKDELMQAVWGDTAVGEDTLTRSIRELRVIFGDDAREPRFIETVHRRGFRLIARVGGGAGGNAVEISSADGPDGSQPHPAPSFAPEGKRCSLVGRSAEIAALLRHYELAASGSPEPRARECFGDRTTPQGRHDTIASAGVYVVRGIDVRWARAESRPATIAAIGQSRIATSIASIHPGAHDTSASQNITTSELERPARNSFRPI